MKRTFLCLSLVFYFVHSTAAQCSEVFKLVTLEKHNEYRQRHGVPPVKLNAALTAEAQQLAEKIQDLGRLVHGDHPKAENLFATWSSAVNSIDPEQAVNRWYDEEADYAPYYGSEPDQASAKDWKRFVNIVWKGTTDIGVGCGLSSDQLTKYVVVRYSPEGQVQGQFSANVLPPIASPPPAIEQMPPPNPPPPQTDTVGKPFKPYPLPPLQSLLLHFPLRPTFIKPILPPLRPVNPLVPFSLAKPKRPNGAVLPGFATDEQQQQQILDVDPDTIDLEFEENELAKAAIELTE